MHLLGAVIFDYSVLLVDDKSKIDDIRDLLQRLQALGIRIGAFSTESRDMAAQMAARDLPPLDVFLSQREVGQRKGSASWFALASEKLELTPQQFLYIGDDDLDWRTALQGGVAYLHATWSKPRTEKPVITVHKPIQVLVFASQFLMVPPRWQFKLDEPSQKLVVRSLMYAYTKLPATTRQMFTPLHVFHPVDPDAPEIKNVDAFVGEMLVLHALTSLHLEGLLEPHAYYTVYPSSTPGMVNEVLEKFLEVSSKLFLGYYRNDLLLRTHAAPDTSDERAKANRRGERYEVNFLLQSGTLCVNPTRKKNIQGRTVILFDDFTTSGTSLDWGRNLLLEAGAKNVILVTIGKYGRTHRMHVLSNQRTISPYKVMNYPPDTFKISEVRMQEDHMVPERLEGLFQAWKNQQPYFPNDFGSE